MIRANWSGVGLKELSEYVLNINEGHSKSHLTGLSVDNIKKKKKKGVNLNEEILSFTSI